MKCEMCGADEELKKTDVEGAILKLCTDCQETGEVVESSSSGSGSGSSSSSTRSTKQRKPRQQRKHLVRDFDTRVKEAREGKDWTIEDLADELKVKQSIVHRIESGKLKPDRELAGKLKKRLGVTLYEHGSGAEYESMQADQDDSEATIGDVATVRKRD